MKEKNWGHLSKSQHTYQLALKVAIIIKFVGPWITIFLTTNINSWEKNIVNIKYIWGKKIGRQGMPNSNAENL